MTGEKEKRMRRTTRTEEEGRRRRRWMEEKKCKKTGEIKRRQRGRMDDVGDKKRKRR